MPALDPLDVHSTLYDCSDRVDLRALRNVSLALTRMTELAGAFSALLADDDESTVPQQPPSTQRQTIALPDFDAFLPRKLSLVVDAGPGTSTFAATHR